MDKTIKEDYVTQEIASLLKENGFYGEIHTTFDKEGYTQQSITHQMAMKWLREVHNIDICVFPYQEDYISFSYKVKIYKDKEMYLSITGSKTYEEAVEAGIKYVLENLI